MLALVPREPFPETDFQADSILNRKQPVNRAQANSPSTGETAMQIQGISQLHGAHSVQPSSRFNQSIQQPQTNSSFNGPDQLDISPEAQLISQSRDVPGIRADRVAAIRAEIQNGTYETDEKLNVALERLLDEIG